MTRARTAGVTLIELMVATSLLVVIAGIAATALHSSHRDDAVAQNYADDLRRLRSALDAVVLDVRSARDVAVEDDVLVVDGVMWELRGDVLVRDDEDIARGIARFDVEAEAGGVVRAGIAPVARAAGARSPTLETRVFPRAGGQR